ncbi:MAG TPA: porin [Terriglobales bacterium]|jgi:phosphate-selective porin OprO/OprP|nr:porin [Terriglobales bacterium]
MRNIRLLVVTLLVILGKQFALAEHASKPASQKAQSPFAVKPDGVFLRFSGDFQLKINGYVQGDARSRTGGSERLLFRRMRPVFELTAFKHLLFRVMPDFGENKTVLQDAYMETRYSPKAYVRIGKFKGPVGLERLQSATSLMFIERGFPTSLVPNRELGLQVHGEVYGKKLAYAAGVFSGVPDGGSIDADMNGTTFGARVFAHPFHGSKTAVANLGIGVAGTVGSESGLLSSFKTPAQTKFFSYGKGTVADGQHYRISPQAYLYRGRVGMLAEYALSSQEVRKNTSTATLSNTAWQVATSLVVTGEEASYKGIKPRRAFEGRNGAFGALELVARYGELRVDESAFPTFADPKSAARKASAWAVGFNWYPARYTKFSTNFERSWFSYTVPGGKLHPENTILTRLQLAF